MNLPSKPEKRKIALVTGASSGIGYELAKVLSKNNYELILCGRNVEALQALQAELVTPSSLLTCDLAQERGRQLLINTIAVHIPDLVVNSAGIGFYGNADADETLEIINVNCTALVLATLQAAKSLQACGREGIILNVSSALAFLPTPLMSAYSASKAFVNSFSLAQDHELASHGIRVLTACPGQVATQFRLRASKGFSPERGTGNAFFVMSPEKVAHEIWKQIQKQQTLRIIDWKVRLLVCIERCLPKRWVMSFLQKEINIRSSKL
ncbi:MAG: Short-chain dehydrogenase/reductase [Chlamydiia bacterium]|nr:Short-chain dehydrogenase/reductase [Chlamydiia bacterium]